MYYFYMWVALKLWQNKFPFKMVKYMSRETYYDSDPLNVPFYYLCKNDILIGSVAL